MHLLKAALQGHPNPGEKICGVVIAAFLAPGSGSPEAFWFRHGWRFRWSSVGNLLFSGHLERDSFQWGDSFWGTDSHRVLPISLPYLFLHIEQVAFLYYRSQVLMELLYCSTEYVSSLNGAPLEYDGQCNSFLPPHLLVIPSHPGVFGPKVLFSSQHCHAW